MTSVMSFFVSGTLMPYPMDGLEEVFVSEDLRKVTMDINLFCGLFNKICSIDL